MMDSGRAGAKSPLHVHVGRGTPVHVHVKRGAVVRPGESLRSQGSLSHARTSTLRSSKGGRKTGSGNRPLDGPWVPPPAKTTKPTRLTWQGPTHQLELSCPTEGDGGDLRMSDLSSETGSDVIRGYERKIDSLMTEVGELKNEVDLQRSLHEVEKKTEELRMSQRVLAEKEDEIEDYRAELEASEIQASRIRRSVDKLKDDIDNSRGETQQLNSQRDLLLKKLVEAEVDAGAAAQQADALRDSVKKLERSRLISSTRAADLRRQRDLLVERLSNFETTNRTLRRLLRQSQQSEGAAVNLCDQRDALVQKLTESETHGHRLVDEVRDRERQIAILTTQIDADKEQSRAYQELRQTMDEARLRLQEQLVSKETECRRMKSDNQSLRHELSSLQQELDVTTGRLTKDKEALKRATRQHRDKAARGEETIESLSAQLAQRDVEVTELRAQCEQLRDESMRTSRRKVQCEAEITRLQSEIEELQHVSETSKETAKMQLGRQIEEAERQKALVRSLERQQEATQQEAAAKLAQSRHEAERTAGQKEQELERVRHQGQLETERVRFQLQQKLSELEPLPELLKTCEMRLQDAQERVSSYERKSIDQTQLIAEMTVKVESQSQQLDSLRDKWQSLMEENRSLAGQVEAAERKMAETEQHNRELVSLASKKEESLQRSISRIEELSHENGSLKRQVDATLGESRRQSDDVRERAAAKERTSQARITDLEAQLSRLGQTNTQLRRDKEETERRSKSRIYSLQDQLEQSQANNRNMENYVRFLKASYVSTYSDASPLAASLR